MFRGISLFTLCLVPFFLRAQPSSANPLAEMKKLDFLVGQWKGTGYMEFGPGQRRTFTETEIVQKKLGGAMVLIEGEGKSKLPGKEEEIVAHKALALVSYDDQAKSFKWYAYKEGSGAVDTTAKVGDQTLQWGFDDPRAGTIRFTIKLNEQGQWFEVGEASRDGKAWQKFFEMTLQNVGAASK